MMAPAQGRALWMELHGYAWSYPEVATAADQRAARAWLADFARRLPFGCVCRREWLAMTEAVPPPVGGRAELYWWTVAAHDAVNHRLGKPLAAPAWSLAHPLMTALGVALHP